MDREPRSARSSRWPRRLAILAVVFLIAGLGFFGVAWIGSGVAEARERARPENFAQVVGPGEVWLEGVSSWTVVYHGPDARQVASEMFQPMIIDTTLTLLIESTIEGEEARLEPVPQDHRTTDDEAEIAWLHLGRGSHRVLVDFHGDAESRGAGTVSFQRWRRVPTWWPLVFVAFLALPCWLLSLVSGLTAGVWAIVLKGFRDRK